MRAMFFALSADDLGELLPSVVEVIVNYSVFELAGVRQLLARVLHAALDDVLGILPAGAHAPLQLLDRRRQDEDADRVGKELAHLLRALPVDFEDQVVAALQRIEDQLLRSAVAVAVHLGALEKLAAAAHGEERRVVDKMVVDDATFLAMRGRGEFLESAEVHGYRYGTSKKVILDALERGDNLILEIDWQGAQQVRKLYPDTVGIFILPPSIEELERRMRARGQDAEAVIQRRMQNAREELSHAGEFKYAIINNHFDNARQQLAEIIRTERKKHGPHHR